MNVLHVTPVSLFDKSNSLIKIVFIKHNYMHPFLGGGGGGYSNIKMPECVCLVSENRPILNDTLSYKTYPY